MTRATARPHDHDFAMVTRMALTLPRVTLATKYDGSPVLQVDGCFLAGLARHPSAEPHTLIVRCPLDERAYWLDEAPGTYYLTDYYRPHPVVLARLPQLDREELHDLLTVSWRLTLEKSPRWQKPSPRV